MKKNIFALTIGALVLTLSIPAAAQQPGKMSLIGYLSRGSGPGANEEIFRQGLRSLGYIEGQTVAIESRFAHEKLDRLPELAAELVRLKVAIIVAGARSLRPFELLRPRPRPSLLSWRM